MTWFDWTLVGWMALSAIATIGMVGHKRDPITPATAVMVVIFNGLFILGLLAVG